MATAEEAQGAYGKYVKGLRPAGAARGTRVPADIAQKLQGEWQRATGATQLQAAGQALRRGHQYWKPVALTGYGFPTRNIGEMGWTELGLRGNWAIFRDVKLADKALKGADDVVRLADGGSTTLKQLLEEAKQLDVMGGFYRTEAAVPRGGGKVAGALKKMTEPVWTPVGMSRRAEERIRLAHFIGERMKGATPTRALDSVARYHHVYGEAWKTALEQVTDETITPFMHFWRRNVPRNITEMVKQPGKFTGALHAKRAIEGTPPYDERYLEQWKQESTPLRTPLGHVLLENWWSPADTPTSPEDFMTEMGSQLSPFLSIPIELARNKSMYTGKPISDFPVTTRRGLAERAEHAFVKPVRPLADVLRAKKQWQRGTPLAAALRWGTGLYNYPYDEQRRARGWEYGRRTSLGEARSNYNYAEKSGDAYGMRYWEEQMRQLEQQRHTGPTGWQ